MKRCEANDYWYFCQAAAAANWDSTLLSVESLRRRERRKWKSGAVLPKKESCEFVGAEASTSEWIQLNRSLISGFIASHSSWWALNSKINVKGQRTRVCDCGRLTSKQQRCGRMNLNVSGKKERGTMILISFSRCSPPWFILFFVFCVTWT